MKKQHSLKKRLISLSLCAAIGFSSVSLYNSEIALAEDYSNHWASEALYKMENLKIMQGDTDGDMHPDRPITRAEFVSMINRAFNYNGYKDKDLPFQDIDGKEWYADNIRVAYGQGYFSGISNKQSGAEMSITREQAAALICRNLKIESKALQIDDFTDGKQISEWSKGSIGAAVEKGYIYGYNDGSFRPLNNITRAEAATMLSNSLGTIITDPGVYRYGTVNGNVTISNSQVEVADTTINGDLYITEGVGTGYVTLRNVNVRGEVIVCGGGEGNWGGSSVTFDNCTVAKLTVDGPKDRPVSISSAGNTSISLTNVKSDAFIENDDDYAGRFLNINFMGPEEAELHLSGNFNNVTVKNPENVLWLGKGTIENLIVDEDAQDSKVILDRQTVVKNARLDGKCEVTGRGDISKLIVSSNGSTVEMLPDEIEIRPGSSATVDGNEMTSLDADESSSYPRILAGYPEADIVEPSKATMIFETNKPGTIRWALTYDDADSLSKEDIMKPTTKSAIKKYGSVSVDESNKDISVSIGGLQSDVGYTISAILVDDRGDWSRVKEETFRTADDTKPDFVSGYPKISSDSSTTLDIEVVTTKDCKVYWAVFPKGVEGPTVYEMRNEEYDEEIDSGSKKKCKKNRSYSFTAEGLKEKEQYDIYVMASDGENDSKIHKLTGSTKDTTPPKFIKDTPKQDKITDKTVDVRVASNEDGTVHYVVCERGDKFPAPVPPATTPPPLDSEEAKQAVVTGNNAFKSGKGTVKQDIESTVKISGLEAETSYDLYMVVMDKAGNISDVSKIVIKTRDVIAPTAKMEFTDSIDGKPKVESDIKIVFSEEVWSSLTMKILDIVNLKDNVKLYDRTSGKSNEVVDIDFTKVKVTEGEKGETVLIFPPESLNLNSGSTYQFELNKIVDTSFNEMKDGYLLDEFTTVPPLVQLVKTESPENMDLTFSIDPQSNKTSDLILFDMIFTSDTTIEFELYKKDKDGKFKKLIEFIDEYTFGDEPDYDPDKLTDYDPLIMKNSAMTLHYIIDRKIKGLNTYKFEPFNKLAYGEFGIRIKAIEGDPVREGWNKTVKIDIKCMSGSKTVLSALAGDPINNYDTAIKEGAVLVNFPTQFVLSASFTDTAIPYFLENYPKLELPSSGVAEEDAQIADTLIRPVIMTDRKADMYYLVAPAGTVDVDSNKDGQYSQEELNTLALPIMSNTLRPNGAVWGTYVVESGNVEYQPVIEGLTPEKQYDVFFVLKGTPPEPSDVWHKRITTAKIAPPKIHAVVNPGENSAAINLTSDKNAKIDWIVLPSNEAKQYLDADGKTVKPELAEVLADIIRNAKENPTLRPVGYGTVTTRYNTTAKEYQATVTVTELERNIYYTFFAVGKTVLSNGQTVGDDSVIAVAPDFTPRDVTPPEITNISTSIGNLSAADPPGTPYKGTLTITFNEPLYYVESEGSKPQPVDGKTFIDNLKGGGVTFQVKDWSGVPVATGSGEKALNYITMTFQGAEDGMTSFVNLLLCDVNGNVSGRFYMTFNDAEYSGGKRGESEWEYEFIN